MPEKVALLSDILWPVGPLFRGARVRSNMLNMPESVSALVPVAYIYLHTTEINNMCCDFKQIE